MSESTKEDIIPQLAKLTGYKPEVLQSIDMPEGKLIELFDRAQAAKKITNFVVMPAIAVVALAIFTPGKSDTESDNDIRFSALMLGVAAYVSGGISAAKKNPIRELNDLRDARLVALAKQQPPGNQP